MEVQKAQTCMEEAEAQKKREPKPDYPYESRGTFLSTFT